MTPHRVVMVPWLRLLGRFLIDRWLAITIGHTVFTWRPLNDAELEHELEHVRQWQRHGFLFPAAYFAAALRARRAGESWYLDNRFEEDASKAASSIKKR